MKFAQLCVDEVHQELARDVANRAGVEVEILEPRDLPLQTPFTAAIVGWDNLGSGRRELLGQLLAVMPMHAIALHTYDIDEQEYLRSRGLTVFQRLDANLFRALVAAVRPQAA